MIFLPLLIASLLIQSQKHATSDRTHPACFCNPSHFPAHLSVSFAAEGSAGAGDAGKAARAVGGETRCGLSFVR